MKTILLPYIFLISVATPSTAQESRRMIDDIKAHRSGTGLWWAGHNSWIIKSGDLVVTTDLYLENNLRLAPSPVTPEEIAAEVDISFVTHAHGDHFNEYTSRILLEKSSCIFVMPESCLPVARKLNIPDNRIVVAKPRTSFAFFLSHRTQYVHRPFRHPDQYPRSGIYFSATPQHHCLWGRR